LTAKANGDINAWVAFGLSLNDMVASFMLQMFVAYLLVKFSDPISQQPNSVQKRSISLFKYIKQQEQG
jgi:hypothetical protein